MRKFLKKAGMVGTAVALSGLAIGTYVTAASASVNSLTVIDGNTHAALTPGTAYPASQAFSVQLPAGAGCVNSGASGAVAYSFMVPLNTTEQSLTFTSGTVNIPLPGQSGPPSNDGFWFAGSTGTVFGGANPATNQIGGVYQLPVPIANTPWVWNGEFGSGSGQLPIGPGVSNSTTQFLLDSGNTTNEGKYLIGIACTLGGTANPAAGAENVWDTEVDFTASGSSFTWSLPSSTPTPETPLVVGLPLAGAGAVVVGVYVIRRRRSARLEPTAVA